MKRQRNHYEASFKTHAVKLSNERDNLSDVARELGITPKLLSRWRKESEQFGHGSFPGNGKPKLTAEEKEMVELKEKMRRIELENEILKKALHIISRDDH